MGAKLALALVAIVAALSLAGTSSAFFVTSGQTGVVGDNQTAALGLNAFRDTTAYVLGVWGSNINPATAQVDWVVDCANPLNDRVGQTQVVVDHLHPAIRYLWVGSPVVGTPWRGWDICAIHVDVQLTAPEDHALAAWLVSHD